MDSHSESAAMSSEGDDGASGGGEAVLAQSESSKAFAPFPLAENLLLIAKDSLPSQAFAAHMSDDIIPHGGAEVKLESRNQPFAPFIIDHQEDAAVESLSNKEELEGALEAALEKRDELSNVTDENRTNDEDIIRGLPTCHEGLEQTVTETETEFRVEEFANFEDTLVTVPEVKHEVVTENGTSVPLAKALRVGAEILERTETSKEVANSEAASYETLVEMYEREAVVEQGISGERGEGSESMVPIDIGRRAVGRQNFPGKHLVNGYGKDNLKVQTLPVQSVPTRDGTPSSTSTPGHQRTPSGGTSIVGDILYSIATGDEEGRNRQRILTFAAKRYANAVERNPNDHDALYNWALVLQESADSAAPEVGASGKDALLKEACKKYEAATRLCPSLHEAFYNWAIAISDRAKIRGRTKEAEELWKQACDRYDQSVQLNWDSPQAFNNWGLALQELSAIVTAKEKRPIVKKSIRKFRAAIQLRFDFHRAVYNLGTVLYGLAEDTFQSGRKLGPKEDKPEDLYSQSAVYIAAAHALKPEYPVYRGALRLVRPMIPLPYLKAGWLTTPPDGNSLAPHSTWERLWFVLDHEALFEIPKVDRKAIAHSYSKRSHSYRETHDAPTSRPSLLRMEMEDIVFMAPCSDLSLPPGGGFRIDTISGPKYLIADTWDAMEAWVDSIRLVYTIYAHGKRDALAGVLVG